VYEEIELNCHSEDTMVFILTMSRMFELQWCAR